MKPLDTLLPNRSLAHTHRALLIAAACGLALPATAQQPQPSPPAQQFQQSQEWSRLPKMLLERQFAGPLQDTVIQRLRDPIDGTVCYLYLPISVAHSQPTSTGFVQYGPNGVGSINCLPAMTSRPAPAAPAKKQ